jgi:hypothetical protein
MAIVDDYAAIAAELRRLQAGQRPEVSAGAARGVCTLSLRSKAHGFRHEGLLRLERTFRLPPSGHPSGHLVPGMLRAAEASGGTARIAWGELLIAPKADSNSPLGRSESCLSCGYYAIA